MDNPRPKMFAAATVTVGTGRRISIPESVLPVVPWLNETEENPYPIRCFAIPGAAGGIQVFPQTGALQALRDEAGESLLEAPPKDNEATKEWMHIVRLLAGGWRSQVTVPNSPKLQIPKKCDVLSFEERTKLVVFASGWILEIWNREAWNSYLATVVASNVTVQRGLQQPFARSIEPSPG